MADDDKTPWWAIAVLAVSIVVIVVGVGDLVDARLGTIPDWIEAVATVALLVVALAFWSERRGRSDERDPDLE